MSEPKKEYTRNDKLNVLRPRIRRDIREWKKNYLDLIFENPDEHTWYAFLYLAMCKLELYVKKENCYLETDFITGKPLFPEEELLPCLQEDGRLLYKYRQLFRVIYNRYGGPTAYDMIGDVGRLTPYLFEPIKKGRPRKSPVAIG